MSDKPETPVSDDHIQRFQPPTQIESVTLTRVGGKWRRTVRYRDGRKPTVSMTEWCRTLPPEVVAEIVMHRTPGVPVYCEGLSPVTAQNERC